jgi:hypothetical protein
MTIPGGIWMSIRQPQAQQNLFALDILICEKTRWRDGYVRREKRVLKQGKMASVVLMALLGASGIRAQEASTPKTKSPGAVDPAISGKQVAALPKQMHRFWDKENALLFAGIGAARTLDYFSTLNLRRRGLQEILITNDAVDNHPAFAAIEAAGTGASIGVSYLFHRYSHHKLERWTSIVHIGVGTTGGVRNYCLKTRHAQTTP